MSDQPSSRSASVVSADVQSPPGVPPTASARRESRNTLQYPAAGMHPYNARSMSLSQAPPRHDSPHRSLTGRSASVSGTAPYLPAGLGMTSSAASIRSNAMSHHTRQLSYGMPRPGMGFAGSVMSSRGLAEIPTATSDNDYLGFCKGAWKVQNGDRKGAMEKCKEAQSWSRNAGKTTTLAAHLKCQQTKCAFRSNYISNDASLIWDKVITHPAKGIKIRWRFLAKSHVLQKVVLKNQFAFKCLICTYTGQGVRAGVYVGTDYYLDHIAAEHRGQNFHDVMLYKIGCINDRVADDDEDFDINMWPMSVHHDPQRETWLSDSLLGDPSLRRQDSMPESAGMNSNEPWIVDAGGYENFDTGSESTVAELAHHPFSPDDITASCPSPPAASSAPAGRPPMRPNNRYEETIRNGQMSPPPTWTQNSLPTSPHSPGDLSRTSEDSQYGLTTCLNNILHVFSEGSVIVDQLKANPAVPLVPLMDLLEQTLQEAPQEIEKEWRRGVTRFGSDFETGDYTAIIALSQMTIQLHKSVVDRLRRAMYDGEPTDLAFLADSGDLARQQTIAILHEYKQRLMQAPPPNFAASVPPTAAAAMYQAQQVQQEAHQPQKHVMHLRPDIWKDPYMPDPAARNAPVASDKPDKNRQNSGSSQTGDSRRRSSVLGSLRDRTSRKSSSSRGLPDPPQSPPPHEQPHPQPYQQPDVDKLTQSVQQNLNIHPAYRNRGYEPKHGPLSEVAELDATAMMQQSLEKI